MFHCREVAFEMLGCFAPCHVFVFTYVLQYCDPCLLKLWPISPLPYARPIMSHTRRNAQVHCIVHANYTSVLIK
jgi:hypothetical protein